MTSNLLESTAPNFLVIGMQKSGTYWVTALLNSHPEISCFPAMYGGQTGVEEGHIFDTLGSIDDDNGEKFKRVFSQAHSGYFADLVEKLDKVDRSGLYDLFRDRYTKFCEAQRNGKRLVGEKTTEYVMYMDIIDYFYPNIKKLCIFRDVRDRIVSFHFHQLRKGQKTEEKISDQYIIDYCRNRVEKEYQSLLNYNGSVYCFRYEDLSTDPNPVINGILDYLGAINSADIIEEMKTSSSFDNLTAKDKITNDRQRGKGEESRKSHYRKGVVGDWKNHLTDKQSDLVEENISDLERRVFDKFGLNK